MAAELVDRLVRQADVAHDRDAGPDDRLDGVGAPLSALELDRAGAAFAHQHTGVLEAGFQRDAIAEERHIRHDQGVVRAPHDGFGVVEHLRHRYPDGAVVAEHHLAERVADQKHRNAGVVQDAGRGEVVGGEHGDLLAVGVQLRDRCDREAGGLLRRWRLAHEAAPGSAAATTSGCASAAAPRESRRMTMRSSRSSATSRLESIGSCSGAASGE